MRFWAAVLLFASLASAASDPLLDRVRDNIGQRLSQAPDFTCVLEIERSVYPTATTPRFRTRDRSRLEVSVVDGKELFAWPGDAFEERPLTDLLGPGLASTGEFSSHGRTTFGDPRTRIERIPEEPAAGLVAYRYWVEAAASRYVLVTTAGNVVAAYQGVFHVDRDRAQVVYFEVNLPDPPQASGLASVTSAVRYGEFEVRGAATWLPANAEIEVVSAQGPAARNQLTFRSCRSFQTETSISFFSEGEETDANELSDSDADALPAGLDLNLELRDAISSDSGWAGDPFRAVLYKNAKTPSGETIPKGAEVSGRVVRLETIDTTHSVAMKDKVRRMTAVSLKIYEARWEGRCSPLAATLQLVQRIPQMARADPGGGAAIGSRNYHSNRASAYETTAELSDPGSGTFIIHGEFYLVRKGSRMLWKTIAAEPSSCSGADSP